MAGLPSGWGYPVILTVQDVKVKNSTIFFLPRKSLRLSVLASFLSGRTFSIWVAGSSTSGAGFPSCTVSSAAGADVESSPTSRPSATPPITFASPRIVASSSQGSGPKLLLLWVDGEREASPGRPVDRTSLEVARGGG